MLGTHSCPESYSVQICALPCTSCRVRVADVLMLSPPACTGLPRTTLCAVAGHPLVSHGVGLHCVQPEPHWRTRQSLPFYYRVYCSVLTTGVPHTSELLQAVIALGQRTDRGKTGQGVNSCLLHDNGDGVVGITRPRRRRLQHWCRWCSFRPIRFRTNCSLAAAPVVREATLMASPVCHRVVWLLQSVPKMTSLWTRAGVSARRWLRAAQHAPPPLATGGELRGQRHCWTAQAALL